ncbi:hypothetical protein SANTM175S_02544 [Streptomyces antimycoticus]
MDSDGLGEADGSSSPAPDDGAEEERDGDGVEVALSSSEPALPSEESSEPLEPSWEPFSGEPFASSASLSALSSGRESEASLPPLESSLSASSGWDTHGPALYRSSGRGLAEASCGVSPMPISTAVGMAASAMALPAGT